MDETSLQIMVERLNAETEGRFITRVHQMTPYHLLLRLRGRGRSGEIKLLLSIATRQMSCHPTSYRYLNPPRPLRFCAYLRHHFQGARIERIEKFRGDRIVILRGRRREGEEKQLVLELTGKSANAVLCSGPEMVIGARMLDLPGAGRLLPGNPWQPPPTGPAAADPAPLVLAAATGRPDPENLPPATLFTLYDNWFYPRYRQAYGDSGIRELIKALKQQRKRLYRREKKLAGEYEEKKGHLNDARLGDLFKSRLHEISRGESRIRVVDYWSPELPEIEIPLDPALSPRENLEKFYKNAKKARRGLEMITARRAQTANELEYLEEIIFQLEELQRNPLLESTEREEEVRQLLELAALLGGRNRPAENSANGRGDRHRKKTAGHRRQKTGPPSSRTRGTERIDGVAGGLIYLGRNALGNENIYRRLGSPEDLWFHIKNRPGAHVLLKTAPGRPENEAEIKQAARLAARNSRAAGESRVEVLMVRIKHLKKPKGARPGQLLLPTGGRTITVSRSNPDDQTGPATS